MRAILARHGNTFGDGDPVIWTGATNDLPLVKRGEEQARELARHLTREGVQPQAVYCGPLIRTRRFAEIVIEEMGLDGEPIVDERLHEIDYGPWTGRTNDEVASDAGQAALQEAWNTRSTWPEGVFGSEEVFVRGDVEAFSEHLIANHDEEDAIVVSSNGRLRYFLHLVPGEWERRIDEGTFKTRTGRFGRLLYDDDAGYSIDGWDIAPDPGAAG